MSAEAKLAAWSAEESPILIEYSLVVIEEIRYAVAEGFQRLSRGGIEVGGILYGKREAQTVRILAMRPIACEHARGPAFLFSDKDRMALNDQLAPGHEDPLLEGLISVGWFLSHTRSGITLTDSDLEIYSIFFPAPWQITLVVRPGRGGVMRAGFFVREADGTVKSERSYLDFDFPDRLAGVFDRTAPRAERPPMERRFLRPSREEMVSSGSNALAPVRQEPVREPLPIAPLPIAPPTFGQSLFPPPQQSKKKWPWLLAWALIVILGAVFAWHYWMPKPVADPISLSVIEQQGQLHIEWNRAAKPVASAVRGAIVINDGHDTTTIPLMPKDLATGKYTYERKTGDIEVRMAVEDADGGKTQEASRFLGQPPVRIDTNELTDVKRRRDELQAEVDRLRRENNAQAEKIQQLQRTIQIMTARGNK